MRIVLHYPATCPQPATMVYLFFLFEQYIFQVSTETSYFPVYLVVLVLPRTGSIITPIG